MSATLTRSSLDSYLNLNVQNSNSVTQNNLQVSKSSDNGVDFAKALSILTSSANKLIALKTVSLQTVVCQILMITISYLSYLLHIRIAQVTKLKR